MICKLAETNQIIQHQIDRKPETNQIFIRELAETNQFIQNQTDRCTSRNQSDMICKLADASMPTMIIGELAETNQIKPHDYWRAIRNQSDQIRS